MIIASALLILVAVAACSSRDASVVGALCRQTGSRLVELPLPADLEASFDQVVAEGMAAMDAVGVTIAVQCAESPLYVKGYGSADLASGSPAAAETVYEIGSISKQFVAAEIMKLAHEERLSLADPIGSFVPALPADWQPVRLDQVLSHTGGIPDHFAIFAENPETPFDWSRDYSPAELVTAFLMLDDRMVAPPGTVFSYSNTGYAILAAVIEEVTEQPFGAALEQGLLAPLGLQRTAFCAAPPSGLAIGYNIESTGPVPSPELPAGFLSGAAGICGTAGDLIRWERQLVSGDAIGREAFAAMSSPAVLEDGSVVPYGLGLHLDELARNRAIFHEGGTAGFSGWLAYYPDHDLIVAVLSNTLGPDAARIRDLVIDLTEAALAG